jgi:hypothetical protein
LRGSHRYLRHSVPLRMAQWRLAKSRLRQPHRGYSCRLAASQIKRNFLVRTLVRLLRRLLESLHEMAICRRAGRKIHRVYPHQSMVPLRTWYGLCCRGILHPATMERPGIWYRSSLPSVPTASGAVGAFRLQRQHESSNLLAGSDHEIRRDVIRSDRPPG